jgi:2-oxoglutarate ferredoxin oxidoreductase subunit beta
MKENKDKKLERELVYSRPECMHDLPTILCPGCQHGLIYRLIGEALDELKIRERAIGVGGVGCHAMGISLLKIDSIMALHGRAPEVATGLKRALNAKPIVFTVQGDGDLAAIGMGDIINAINRGEKLTTIFCNNAGYGTTGGQMAPTTLLDQVTTTTPEGRIPQTFGYPTHVAELLATMQGMAFSARCALTSVAQFNQALKAVKKAFQKQIDGIGYGFVELLTACPPTFKKTPVDSLKWIMSHMLEEFPLGIFKDVDQIS